jgi:hypothetical protein
MGFAQPRELPQASIHVVEGHSLVVPLIVEGLPGEIEALGRRWLRKHEFHLTAVAARVIERLDPGVSAVWDTVARVASGRLLGPIQALEEVRRVVHPERPQLQSLIVMASCPGLEELYGDLERALQVVLRPPPAHVTLYSSDPAEGIGIVDRQELADRAPPLSTADQAALRRAMRFCVSREPTHAASRCERVRRDV